MATVDQLESKAALAVITDDGIDSMVWTLRRTSGSFESRRLQMLEVGSSLIGYYSEASAALGVDMYDDARAEASVRGRFNADPIILDRTVRVRRGLAWASDPLSTDDEQAAIDRLTDILRTEVARPYRDTVIGNRLRDRQSVGYRRVASGSACGFCRMLAGRGAVYKQASAYFASHGNCQCTVVPVFQGQAGEEANVIEYMASRRNKTEKQRARVREWIAAEYPDEAERSHTRTSR